MVQDAVNARKIQIVWHFTRLINLPEILTHGLIPRAVLEVREQQPPYNDHYRHDMARDAVCCSIAHPNYKMFYSLRMQNPDDEWAVVALKPNVLWEKDCAFCAENAASAEVTSIPQHERKGIAAFNKLFDEVEGKPTRAELKLPDACPTNPQAEILIFGTIEPTYFVGVVVQNKATETRLRAEHPTFKFLLRSGTYGARKDYQHWQ